MRYPALTFFLLIILAKTFPFEQGPTEKAEELYNDTMDDAAAASLVASGKLPDIARFFNCPNIRARWFAAGRSHTLQYQA